MDDYRKLSREWGSKARKEESRQRKTRLRALTELTEDYGGYLHETVESAVRSVACTCCAHVGQAEIQQAISRIMNAAVVK
jgi:flagellar motor switch protein FliM